VGGAGSAMAGRTGEPRPDAHHVVWGNLEVNGEGSSENVSWSSAALREVQIIEDSSSSLRSHDCNQDVETHGPLGSGSRAMMPQALGDQGLNINSDGEAEEDAGRGSCYNYELHNSGRCKPCNFFGKKVGCTGGDSCTFCHLPHTEQKRARPSKVKRDRCKVIVESKAAAAAEQQRAAPELDSDRVKEIVGRESLQGSYMRSILASRAKREDDSVAASSGSGPRAVAA